MVLYTLVLSMFHGKHVGGKCPSVISLCKEEIEVVAFRLLLPFVTKVKCS